MPKGIIIFIPKVLHTCCSFLLCPFLDKLVFQAAPAALDSSMIAKQDSMILKAPRTFFQHFLA
jgi:hypothetical protein